MGRGGWRGPVRFTALPGLLLGVPLAGLWATVPAGASPGVVTTYTDPSLLAPGGITAGPDGAVWFTNSTSIGRISTAGKITHYRGTGISDPRSIVAGPDGALWFTNEGTTSQGSIGRITTAGVVTNFADPTISAPIGITVGPDGALWFTNLGDFNAGDLGSIGRITTAGAVTNYRDPTISEPIDITSGSDGALWFTNEGTSSIGSIGRITTTGTVTDHADANIRQPGFIAAGPDGALWFTNDTAQRAYSIGRITTDGTVTKFTDPSIDFPFGIAAGPDGAIWFANANGRSIGRITTSGIVTSYRDPRVSGPQRIAAGPDGSMWFTNAGIDPVPTSIGRITTSVNATPSWTLTSIPNDTARDFTFINDISCVSATSCTAVGYSFAPAGPAGRSVVESWNGVAWSRVSSPNLGTIQSSLFSVSCVSTTSCKAVGIYVDKANRARSLIESWNGHSWSAIAGPSPGTLTNQLLGVSCVSSTSCQAVGYSGNGINAHRAVNERTLAMSWNGHSWSIVSSPNPGTGNAQLNGVSCVSATSCTAVGNTRTSSGGENRTLAESWNGHSWSFVSSPNRGTVGALAGVSCVSKNACQAVGNFITTSNPSTATSRPLSESWNGHAWSLLASPALSATLADVSCTSVKSCTAVGSAGRVTLAESWNGAAWSVVASPNQGNNDTLSSNGLSGVSCVSPTSCQAVGTWNQDGFAEALAESFG